MSCHSSTAARSSSPFSRNTPFQCATRSPTLSFFCASKLICRMRIVWALVAADAVSMSGEAAVQPALLARRGAAADLGVARGGPPPGAWWWDEGVWAAAEEPAEEADSMSCRKPSIHSVTTSNIICSWGRGAAATAAAGMLLLGRGCPGCRLHAFHSLALCAACPLLSNAPQVDP